MSAQVELGAAQWRKDAGRDKQAVRTNARSASQLAAPQLFDIYVRGNVATLDAAHRQGEIQLRALARGLVAFLDTAQDEKRRL